MDMQRLFEAEPFLGYLGLEVVEARGGTAVLRLPLRREVTNHAASVHGGAQYALGEATAIALAATLFAEQVADLNLLTAHASIDYRSLARGTLTARAELPAEDCERIRAELGERGRVRFPVAVALTDADGTTATTLTVEVAVRARA
ncbi:MAG TPA: YiiD C-terminal domain-containing protein [Ktedonobacterales bacterium]|nr:YiiD C-terminal domain-containing protein [Ktedonobacterales bacterium]